MLDFEGSEVQRNHVNLIDLVKSSAQIRFQMSFSFAEVRSAHKSAQKDEASEKYMISMVKREF